MPCPKPIGPGLTAACRPSAWPATGSSAVSGLGPGLWLGGGCIAGLARGRQRHEDGPHDFSRVAWRGVGRIAPLVAERADHVQATAGFCEVAGLLRHRDA